MPIEKYEFPCPDCDGTGKEHQFDFKDCYMCGGSGSCVEDVDVCADCHGLPEDCDCCGDQNGPWPE